MQSIITSKYQTTIPKSIRDQVGLSVKDVLNWKVEKGKIIIFPARTKFLERRNSVKVGKGDIRKDIDEARRLRGGKHE